MQYWTVGTRACGPNAGHSIRRSTLQARVPAAQMLATVSSRHACLRPRCWLQHTPRYAAGKLACGPDAGHSIHHGILQARAPVAQMLATVYATLYCRPTCPRPRCWPQYIIGMRACGAGAGHSIPQSRVPAAQMLATVYATVCCRHACLRPRCWPQYTPRYTPGTRACSPDVGHSIRHGMLQACVGRNNCYFMWRQP